MTSQTSEPAKKSTIHDRVEMFSKLTFEQADAKKVLVRNLKGLMHRVVRVQRKNLLKAAIHSSLPLDMAQPGSVMQRRVGSDEWQPADAYNQCAYGEDFTPLIGMVIDYELIERESGGSVYLIVAVPGDRFEYQFDVSVSKIEILDTFPAE